MFSKPPPPSYDGNQPPPYVKTDNNWSSMAYIDAVGKLIKKQTLSDDFLKESVYTNGKEIPNEITSLKSSLEFQVNEYTTGTSELVARVTFGKNEIAANMFCLLLVTAYEIGSVSHTDQPKRATFFNDEEYSMVLTQDNITKIAEKHNITMPLAPTRPCNLSCK